MAFTSSSGDNAGTVGVQPQPGLVQQHPAQARSTGADDVDVIEIADVNRRLLPGAAARQGDLEESRIRLFDAFVGRIEHVVEPRSQSKPIHVRAQRAVGVGDHDQPQSARA